MPGSFASEKIFAIAALTAVLIAGAVTATPAAAHPNHGGYYDRLEDRRDRAEDRADRREDYWDRREDLWDARHFTGPGDIIEDYYDRLEDRRDRAEDRRDRREDFRDHRH